MNKQLALLKYKLRNCYDSTETMIDLNNPVPSAKAWMQYRKNTDNEFEIWSLLDFTDYGFHNFSHRYEYYAIGDPNPILVYFCGHLTFLQDDHINHYEILKYKLPEKWIAIKGSEFYDDVRSVLCEYERCRTEWETRIAVVNPPEIVK